ncbi:MAG: hypothetical protein ACRELY_06650 [Polyangiaceae bacterium]
MSLMKRAVLLVPLAAYFLCAAPACSSDSPATPRVLLQSNLGAGNQQGVNDSTVCSFSARDPWVTIGDPTNSASVADGDTDGNTGQVVSVSCDVTPEGDGFHVQASAQLGSQGAVTVTGHFTNNTPAVSADTPIQNISASFSRADTGSFTESTCTVTYTTNPQFMGVAAGRVWADIDCPTATYSSQNKTCEGTASFKFENCGGASTSN